MPMLLLVVDTNKLWNIDTDDESIEVVHQILGVGLGIESSHFCEETCLNTFQPKPTFPWA
jgi:hypothetical protein